MGFLAHFPKQYVKTNVITNNYVAIGMECEI